MNRLHYIVICLILLCVFACKKKNNEPTTATNNTATPVNFDFSYSGDQWAYRPISFISTLSDTATVTWDFGDGEITHHITQSHNYKADGNYTVKLSAYGNTVTKTIKIGLGLDTILTKLKHWTRVSSYQVFNPSFPEGGGPFYGTEQSDLDFTLTYEIVTNALTSTYPYKIIIPGGDSRSDLTFNTTSLYIISSTPDFITLKAPDAIESTIYRNNNPSILQIVQYKSDSTQRIYKATYISK